MTTTWNTWTLPSNLATVAANQRRDEQAADQQVNELLATIDREWRVMVKDVRFAFYGGVDSPECRRAYVGRRVAEVRRALVAYLHRPSCRAYDEALEAVEIEIA